MSQEHLDQGELPGGEVGGVAIAVESSGVQVEADAVVSVSMERVQFWETIDLVTAMLHAWTKVRLLRVEPRLIVLRHAVDALGALR
jgi:hypothetical protein